MSARRPVRALSAFFTDLDRQLSVERGPDGHPSRSDFRTYDLPAVIDEFATGWEALPQLIPGRPEYRVLVTAGRLVAMISVVGQLTADGAVELVEVELDLGDEV